ncbi:LysR family transcriptional regulator [Spirillospora sp. NPDC046719]
MDSRYLRAFVAVAETGGISSAAERLGYAQSSLSIQLRRLEDDLGVRVLARTSTGTALTDAGRRLLPYAVQSLELEDRMRRAARDVAPRLRVGALDCLADEWTTDLLAAFQHGAAGPGTAREVDLAVGDRAFLAAGLEAGRLDLVFVYDNGAPATGPHEIVDEDRVVLVAAPEHPLAQASPLDPAALMTAEFLIVNPECTSEMLTRRYGRALGPGTRIGMATGSLAALRRMAALGRGVALVPETAVRAELDAGDLVRLDPAVDEVTAVHIEARWRPGAEPLVRPLVELARRSAGLVRGGAGAARAS